jgi:hypothetical protein
MANGVRSHDPPNGPVSTQVAVLASALRGHAPELAGQLAGRIIEQIDFYAEEGLVPREDLRESCRDNLEFAEAGRSGTLSDAELVRIASDVWALHEAFAAEMMAAYRDELTRQALHLARVALASSVPGGAEVCVFDDAPVPVLVASSPATSYRIAERALGPLMQIR